MGNKGNIKVAVMMPRTLKGKRYDNEQKAQKYGWTIHTEHHWSRDLNGKRLNYWPSRNKFQYDGRVWSGDVYEFIKNREMGV